MGPSIPPGLPTEPGAMPPFSPSRIQEPLLTSGALPHPAQDPSSLPLPVKNAKIATSGFARWARPPPPPPGLERGRPCPAGCRVSAFAPSAWLNRALYVPSVRSIRSERRSRPVSVLGNRRVLKKTGIGWPPVPWPGVSLLAIGPAGRFQYPPRQRIAEG